MAVYKDSIRTKHVCQISECEFIKSVRDELGLYDMQFSKTNVISVAEFVYAVEMVAAMLRETGMSIVCEFIESIWDATSFVPGDEKAFLKYILERVDGTFIIEHVDVPDGYGYFQIDEVI